MLLFFLALFVFEQVSAVAVDGNDQREILEAQTFYTFAAQILKSDDLALFDAFGCQRAGAAHCTEVNGLVADDGIANLITALTFTDHGFQTHIQQTGRIGIHSSGGGGTAGTDGQVGRRSGRTGIVDRCAVHIKGQLFSLVQKTKVAFVRRITGSMNGSGKQHALTGFQLGSPFFQLIDVDSDVFHG